MRPLVALLMVLAGCYLPAEADPMAAVTDPVEEALRLWESQHGAAQPRCVREMHLTTFVEMHTDEIAAACGFEPDARLAGCMYEYDVHGPEIGLNVDNASGRWQLTRVHEVLHALHQCEAGTTDGDSHHRDVVWSLVGQTRGVQ